MENNEFPPNSAGMTMSIFFKDGSSESEVLQIPFDDLQGLDMVTRLFFINQFYMEPWKMKKIYERYPDDFQNEEERKMILRVINKEFDQKDKTLKAFIDSLFANYDYDNKNSG